MRSSPGKVAANRANAISSTGPKTLEGKVVSSQNAIKHGLLSRLPVVPGLEKESDWDAHRGAILASLAPWGYFETALADRIALALWRLGRVARYEREDIQRGQEMVDADAIKNWLINEGRSGEDFYYQSLDDVTSEAKKALNRFELLLRFQKMKKANALTGEEAWTILLAVSRAAGVRREDCSFPALPRGVSPEAFGGWTAGLLNRAIKDIACMTGKKPKEILKQAHAATCQEATRLALGRKKMIEEADRLQQERSLPSAENLEKIGRYEAHLERSLFRTLHELQRLQAARAGQFVPPPAALDVNLVAHVDGNEGWGRAVEATGRPSRLALFGKKRANGALQREASGGDDPGSEGGGSTAGTPD